VHVSLFSGRSFIGRTYTGKKLEMDTTTFKLKQEGTLDVDWFVLNTKLADPKVSPIIDFSVVIKKTENSINEKGDTVVSTPEDVGRVGIGFMMIPIFENAAPASMKVDMKFGTPRDIIANTAAENKALISNGRSA
jgi:hypothetical protein